MKRFLILVVMMMFCSLAWGQVKKDKSFRVRLVSAAMERTEHEVVYDGAYRGIAYPGGDVPDHIGVCTDVVIRSYRKLGIDVKQIDADQSISHVWADMNEVLRCDEWIS